MFNSERIKDLEKEVEFLKEKLDIVSSCLKDLVAKVSPPIHTYYPYGVWYRTKEIFLKELKDELKLPKSISLRNSDEFQALIDFLGVEKKQVSATSARIEYRKIKLTKKNDKNLPRTKKARTPSKSPRAKS